MRSRVSPRAGGSNGLDGEELAFSTSILLSLEAIEVGVPGLGDGEYAR